MSRTSKERIRCRNGKYILRSIDILARQKTYPRKIKEVDGMPKPKREKSGGKMSEIKQTEQQVCGYNLAHKQVHCTSKSTIIDLCTLMHILRIIY